jgi:hypothetical protein
MHTISQRYRKGNFQSRYEFNNDVSVVLKGRLFICCVKSESLMRSCPLFETSFLRHYLYFYKPFFVRGTIVFSSICYNIKESLNCYIAACTRVRCECVLVWSCLLYGLLTLAFISSLVFAYPADVCRGYSYSREQCRVYSTYSQTNNGFSH